MSDHSSYDAAILGGGPAGATAARGLARLGRRVVVLERESFPRFHIGESFLPRNLTQIREAGLEPELARIPHVTKLGAEFLIGSGDEHSSDFTFADALGDHESIAFNIERAPFDAMLLNAAREAGAEVREGVKVTGIERLADDDCVIKTGTGRIRARYVIDASGQATVVGRHLGTRRVLPRLRKVAYFAHLHGVFRRQGRLGGYPTVVMCHEGWFWLIPIDEERTSVGLVLDDAFARSVGVPPDRMLRWGIETCPEMRRRCREAEMPRCNGVTADFSYTCRPYAGGGYFLVGDAATFVDPIFSTGVCLGMVGGEFLAGELDLVLGGRQSARRARRRYVHFLSGSSSTFFTLVEMFYDHAFREMFLHGTGPFNIHRAVIALLAGNVFPGPPFSLRWRLRIFQLLIRMHRCVPLVPRRAAFSLAEAAADRDSRSRRTNEVEGFNPAPDERAAEVGAGL